MKRGFFLVDMLLGLGIVVILALALAVVVAQERRALQQMEHRRMAQRVAEGVLSDLQTGHTTAPNLQIHVSVVPGNPPAGYEWCKVQATDNGQQATLIGLVPARGFPK